MNIIFWFLTLLGLAVVWFLFNPVFKIIGATVLDAVNNIKKNISQESTEEKGNENNGK